MANKKKIKRKFLISGELTWIHVVIFLILCLVFIRETRFTFGGGLIKDIPDIGEISSEYLSDYEDFDEGEGEDNHAAAGGDEEENFKDENNENENEKVVLRNTKGGGNEGHFTIFDQMPEFERGDITVCNPDDISKCITIMDRNLGANTDNINDTGSYGYYYQRGNNYGFEGDVEKINWTHGNIHTSCNANSYSGNLFYIGGYFLWMSCSYPTKLRGGENDSSANNYGGDLDNYGDRQGPCPNGYHIPSYGEYNNMIRYYVSYYNGQGNAVIENDVGVSNSSGNFGEYFSNYFKIPKAGALTRSGVIDTSRGLLWSSSPTNQYQPYFYNLNVGKNYVRINSIPSSYGLSLRCVRNVPVVIKNFVEIRTQFEGALWKGYVLSGNKLKAPSNYNTEKYIIKGFYKDTGLINKFDDIITGDTVIYADWICQKGYKLTENGESCEIETYNINRLNMDGSIIKTDIVEYGQYPSYVGDIPTMPDDECYTYTFSGWPRTPKATQDASYTAIFNQNGKYYSVTYIDGEKELEIDQASCGNYYLRGDIEKPGYIFEGWYFDSEFVKRAGNSVNIIDDIAIYGKRESCPDGYIAQNNKCILESAGIFYESGVIKVTDGETTYYVKDMNQGAQQSVADNKISKILNLKDEYDICNGVEKEAKRGPVLEEEKIDTEETFFQEVSKIAGVEIFSCDDLNNYLDNPLNYQINKQMIERGCSTSVKIDNSAEAKNIEVFEKTKDAEKEKNDGTDLIGKIDNKNDENDCTLEIINEVTNKDFDNLDDARDYINNYDEIILSYGTYYYRGNNTGAYYEELNVNGEDININEETFMRGFNGGKINGLEQGWINTDDGNSPCDASKGEYLPTAEQWQGLRDLYYNINRSMDNFEQDLLIPQAGNIYYHDSSMDAKKGFKSSLSLRDFFGQAVIAEEIDVFRTISNKYKPYSSLLWLAINENSQNGDDENIGKGIMDNIYAVDRGQYYGLDNISNNVAAPVRCFIKGNDEFVVKYYIDGEELFSETILSGNRAEQPKISQKEGYTFKGRYTEDGKTYDFSVPVTSDIELYARFEQNKSSSSNGGGGGGSSLKKDNCPDGDYSDSYYDGTCGKKKVIEDSSAMPQNDGKGSQDSPTKPQNDKTGHNSADEVVYDTLRFNPHYSDEMNRAYQFAYHYGITTKTNIKDAAMNWELTRIAMAKMLSQYAINVLGIQPDKSRNNQFADVSDKLDTEYDDGVTLAYQLGIMGINMPNNEFKPYNYVTRAEFATALSRLLYHTSDGMFEKTSRYYVPHINKLAYEGILTNMDPYMKELRGYVMLMLMRSAK